MCGIVGYIGGKKAVPIILNGLKKLEYRGYDSAGIAFLDNSDLKVIKCKGRIFYLEEKLKESIQDSMIGIGHTRWATHGEPNDINSHPHISSSGKVSVVHNGIIENYIKLKEFLKNKGYNFISDTDTEVIAHLIEFYYKNDILEAVLKAINDIEGSYALGVICSDYPDAFVAARKDSPLIIGIGRGENFIASDIPAVLEHTREIYILEDKEVALIKKDSVEVFNNSGEKVNKETFHVDWDISAAEKSGYDYFMMKEMHEEPNVVKDTINSRIKDGEIVIDNIDYSKDYIQNINKIFIVACGTAYHAGIVGKYIIEKLAKIPVECDVASEFRYREPIIGENDLMIVISQSGETLDTLMALREAKKKGTRVLSIVNVVGSSIARSSDDVLYTWAGPEIAVASTKAYNTQLSALYLLALDFAKKRETISVDFYKKTIQELISVPELIEKALGQKEEIKNFAKKNFNAKDIFYIGRGLDYALSMEGSLKLKEISYIHSEAYAGGELKHGTIALIEDGTLVVCPVTQDYLVEKMISNMREVKARGAKIMAITQENNDEVSEIADTVIYIPDVEPLLAPIVAVTLLQLFAYYMAVEKGCDVDKPRNLAKSVTVE